MAFTTAKTAPSRDPRSVAAFTGRGPRIHDRVDGRKDTEHVK
jgi:hypothetical protein